MDMLAGAGTILLLIVGAAIWMYAVAHAFFNHGHGGIAILVMLVPAFAIAYVLLHRCPDRGLASSS